jgi:hypothetical protein
MVRSYLSGLIVSRAISVKSHEIHALAKATHPYKRESMSSRIYLYARISRAGITVRPIHGKPDMQAVPCKTTAPANPD